MKIPVKFLKVLLMYTLITFTVFAAIYGSIDIEKHFELPAKPDDVKRVKWDLILYMTFMIQTGYMSENYPKTQLGRTIVSLQAFCSWLPMLVLLAPWTATQTGLA